MTVTVVKIVYAYVYAQLLSLK